MYLASLKHEKQLKLEERKLLAIKRLIPTSNPKRIEQELKCLMQIGGVDNVGGIEACVRQQGLVAFVLPFMRHDKFHDYFDKMDPAEIKIYLKNLLIALKRVHKFNIIHRDVKPSNFLYNRKMKSWLLVDFGLAQKAKEPPLPSPCSKRRDDREEENNPPKRLKMESFHVASKGKDKSILAIPVSPFKSPLKSNHTNIPPALATAVKSACLGFTMNTMLKDRKPIKCQSTSCFCFTKNQVCNICIVKREIHASRAGTPGYRPPEVLLKYPYQTTAIDIWAAGVIFLSLLSKSYPFFRAHDDFTALAEMITIFGDKRFRELAHNLDRNIKIGRKMPPLDIKKLCILLRNRTELIQNSTKCINCQQSHCLCINKLNFEHTDDDEYGANAYDLLQKMLELDPKKRITAENAINHPYFQEQVILDAEE